MTWVKGSTKGRKNINWRGGVADYPNHYLMKKNRLIILLNDPKCEKCRKKPATEIHHRNLDQSDHRLKNLMPICRKCNSHIHHKKPKYGKTLKELAKKFSMSPSTIRIRLKQGLPLSSKLYYTSTHTSKYIRKYGRTLKEISKMSGLSICYIHGRLRHKDMIELKSNKISLSELLEILKPSELRMHYMAIKKFRKRKCIERRML